MQNRIRTATGALLAKPEQIEPMLHITVMHDVRKGLMKLATESSNCEAGLCIPACQVFVNIPTTT